MYNEYANIEISKIPIRVNEIGNDLCKYLDKIYSPNSHVPCVDLISYFTKLMIEGNVEELVRVIDSVCNINNNRLFNCPEYKKHVDTIMQVKFDEFVSGWDELAIFEMKSFLILMLKEGLDARFYLTKNYQLALSKIISCYNCGDICHVDEKIKNFNKFVKAMRKDAPYWDDVIYKKNVESVKLCDDETSELMCKLRPMTRLYLIEAVNHCQFRAEQISSYWLRSIGLDLDSVVNELLSLGVIEECSFEDSKMLLFNKDELIQIAVKMKLNFKSGWRKDKLVSIIECSNSDIFHQRYSTNKIYQINEAVSPLIYRYENIAMANSEMYSLLFY